MEIFIYIVRAIRYVGAGLPFHQSARFEAVDVDGLAGWRYLFISLGLLGM